MLFMLHMSLYRSFVRSFVRFVDIYMLWSFLISFWNTSLILLCSFCSICIVLLTSKTRDWNLWQDAPCVSKISLLSLPCSIIIIISIIIVYFIFDVFHKHRHVSFYFCNWLCNSIRCQSKSIFGLFSVEHRNWCCLFDKWNVKWIFIRRYKDFHFRFHLCIIFSLVIEFFFFLSFVSYFSEWIWFFYFGERKKTTCLYRRKHPKSVSK